MGLNINKNVAVGKSSPYDVHLNPAKGNVAVIKVEDHKGKPKTETVVASESQTVHPGIQTFGQPCKVRISGGQTIQSPIPYESFRVDVSLEVPCEKDQIEETFEFASDWVSTKIMNAVKDIKG